MHSCLITVDLFNFVHQGKIIFCGYLFFNVFSKVCIQAYRKFEFYWIFELWVTFPHKIQGIKQIIMMNLLWFFLIFLFYFRKEICDPKNNFTMCPLCDFQCPYWNLYESCSNAIASRMFDNGGTVFFAIFMSFWGKLVLSILIW